MKSFIPLLLILAFSPICSWGQVVIGTVVDEKGQPAEFASVSLCRTDSSVITMCVTDVNGKFETDDSSAFPVLIKVSMLGYETKWAKYPLQGSIRLEPLAVSLGEVVVKGRKRLVKMSDSGLVYDMSNNVRAQSENLLQALRYVPLLEVDAKGVLTVKGNNKYALYLNGRPYEIAQANPTQVLQSIPASKIKKIEVIKETDSRFINTDGTPIVNIITDKKSLEGIYTNLSGGGDAQPKANTGLSVLATKGKVDMSVSYNYSLNGQRDQPITQCYKYADKEVNIDGKGDGDWINHTVRLMTKWHIDSLNVLYADAHARINVTNFTTFWNQTEALNDGTQTVSQFDNINDNTSGTVETNVIYRNYFRKKTSREHFAIGYRYTYNPDKRHFSQHLYDADGGETVGRVKTDGGLHDHTVDFSTIVPLASRHLLRIGVSDILRVGSTSSSSLEDINYTENLLTPYFNYTGRVKPLVLTLSARGEYDYLKMKLPYQPESNFRRNNFYIIPSAKVDWRMSDVTRLGLEYSMNVQRPSIEQLNSFYSANNNYTASCGNPNLKTEKRHNVILNYSLFGSNIMLSSDVTYTHTADAVLYYKQGEAAYGRMLSTYDNFGNVNSIMGSLYVNWNPLSFLSLQMYLKGGYYDLRALEVGLKQHVWNNYAQAQANIYLPKSLTMGRLYRQYKNVSAPWSTENALNNYSLRIDKNWLKGALTTGIEVNSPFRRYMKLNVTTSKSDFWTRQTNYITARSFGERVSYSFSSGKTNRLNRDKTLQSKDQNTGVN